MTFVLIIWSFLSIDSHKTENHNDYSIVQLSSSETMKQTSYLYELSKPEHLSAKETTQHVQHHSSSTTVVNNLEFYSNERTRQQPLTPSFPTERAQEISSTKSIAIQRIEPSLKIVSVTSESRTQEATSSQAANSTCWINSGMHKYCVIKAEAMAMPWIIRHFGFNDEKQKSYNHQNFYNMDESPWILRKPILHQKTRKTGNWNEGARHLVISWLI